jgi:hypothetical protein
MFFITETGDFVVSEGGAFVVTEDHSESGGGDTGGGCYILAENGDIIVAENGDPLNQEGCTPTADSSVGTGSGGARRRPSRVWSAVYEDEPVRKIKVEIVEEQSNQITPVEWVPSSPTEIDEVLAAFLSSAGDLQKAMEESDVLARRLKQAQRRRNQQRILMMIIE